MKLCTSFLKNHLTLSHYFFLGRKMHSIYFVHACGNTCILRGTFPCTMHICMRVWAWLPVRAIHRWCPTGQRACVCFCSWRTFTFLTRQKLLSKLLKRFAKHDKKIFWFTPKYCLVIIQILTYFLHMFMVYRHHIWRRFFIFWPFIVQSYEIAR